MVESTEMVSCGDNPACKQVLEAAYVNPFCMYGVSVESMSCESR